jgi:hypothetical protein
MTTDNKRTAIVIGGSMAGLLAARDQKEVIYNTTDQANVMR